MLVRVADTGSGMDPDVAAHAFEPFFTTKDVGKGTGLGLSQVYGFIKQSGGHVVIDSSPGVGTTFRLYLPKCDDVRRIGDDERRAPGATPTGHETVLVVEDNAEVLELAVNTIGDLGYRVLTAADGPSALDIVRAMRRSICCSATSSSPAGWTASNWSAGARHSLWAEGAGDVGYAGVHRPGPIAPTCRCC